MVAPLRRSHSRIVVSWLPVMTCRVVVVVVVMVKVG
jgi:hypothetical protein